MPDESCRICGGLLIDFAQCAECKKLIAMICKSCGTKTAEQFHSECILTLTRSEHLPKNTLKNFYVTTIA